MKIQIIEDDKALSDGIRLALRTLEQPEGMSGSAFGYPEQAAFVQSFDVAQAEADFLREEPDMLILDINLPDASGYDFLKWVRKRSAVPVLVLTANDLEMDEVMSLSLGADDYMSKPFSLAVLRARIQALFRRAAVNADRQPDVFAEDGFLFDFARIEFLKDGMQILLSVNEQKLLRMLVENKEHVLTRNVLYEYIWSDGSEFVDENALSVTVNRLRSKLEEKQENVTYIQTVYGQGYMWKKKCC